MITNWLLVIGMLLAGAICYLWGLTRGINETERKYADEYIKGWEACLDFLEDAARDKREKKAEGILRELRDLFDPECPIPDEAFPDPPERIIDAGEY